MRAAHESIVAEPLDLDRPILCVPGVLVKRGPRRSQCVRTRAEPRLEKMSHAFSTPLAYPGRSSAVIIISTRLRWSDSTRTFTPFRPLSLGTGSASPLQWHPHE